jgi:hypothetical protein
MIAPGIGTINILLLLLFSFVLSATLQIISPVFVSAPLYIIVACGLNIV